MVGNIWISSAVIVTAIFSASAIYKSYNDIQDAKQLKESYKIIADIKGLLAEQYDKSPDEITRDEIILQLPSGKNWEKVLLLNRSGNLNDDAIVDESGNFVLSKDEKIKLLALRSTLKNYGIEDEEVDNKMTFKIGQEDKNIIYKDNNIETSIIKTIEIIDYELSILTETKFDELIDNLTPYDEIYQNMKRTDSEVLTSSEVKNRKKAYFVKRIKDKLLTRKNAKDIRIYDKIKSF